jgi:fumarylacetoacetate (FAA) hydrolase
MKLASLRRGGRDGTLAVASRDLARAVRVPDIAPTLQAALDDWPAVAPALAAVAARLETAPPAGAFALEPEALASPLPRAYQFADGSAYVVHVELVRRARGAEMPPSFWTDPLMYQGLSDGFLGPTEPIRLADEGWGIDFEAEVAVITDDVPMGVAPDVAAGHIRLVMLLNDVSLRNLIPGELAKGFGFFQSKPASACSPVAVTPDELGAAWRDGRLHGPLLSFRNGVPFGRPDCGRDMVFDFPTLIAHAARTRRLGAGSIIGSGTVANRDPTVGCSCIAETRTRETLAGGGPRTPFLTFGETIRIEMRDESGASLFGAIEQRVERHEPGAAA